MPNRKKKKVKSPPLPAPAEPLPEAPVGEESWRYILRMIGSGLLLLAIIANMVMIFIFSAESISESSDRSSGVIIKICQLIFRDYDELDWLEKEHLYSAMATPVRKLAHITEYASLGFLTAAFLMPLRSKERWVPWVIPAGFCLIYAASDEIHQIFSHRGASVVDVGIDFAGAVIGILLAHFVFLLIRVILTNGRRVKEIKKKKNQEEAQMEAEPTVVIYVDQPDPEVVVYKTPLLAKLLRKFCKKKSPRLKGLGMEEPHQYYGRGSCEGRCGRWGHGERVSAHWVKR